MERAPVECENIRIEHDSEALLYIYKNTKTDNCETIKIVAFRRNISQTPRLTAESVYRSVYVDFAKKRRTHKSYKDAVLAPPRSVKTVEVEVQSYLNVYMNPINDALPDIHLNNQRKIFLKDYRMTGRDPSGIDIINDMDAHRSLISPPSKHAFIMAIVTNVARDQAKCIYMKEVVKYMATRWGLSSSNHETADDCVICMSAIKSKDDTTKTRCGHILYEICINQWFTTNTTHPSCLVCRNIHQPH